MGILGPLTAQALGRSPYEDVAQAQTLVETHSDPRQPEQQFDAKGRPINPKTKEINRSLVRAHNEVMQVIGVAEPDGSVDDAANEAKYRHYTHESNVGRSILVGGMYCIGSVGIFGLTGFRERTLTYKRYGQMSLWELLREMTASAREVYAGRLPYGIASNMLKDYADHKVAPFVNGLRERPMLQRFIVESWSYIRTHLTLWATCQRLGLAPRNQLLPPITYFIPCSSTSPIPPPPFARELSIDSILQWLFQCAANAAPFFLWSLTLSAYKYVSIWMWPYFIQSIPSTMFREPLPRQQTKSSTTPPDTQLAEETDEGIPEPSPLAVHVDSTGDDASSAAALEVADQHEPDTISSPHESFPAGYEPADTQPAEIYSRPYNRADDAASDYDDAPDVGPTLISFDVEPSDSADMPPEGVWSAELRQSNAHDHQDTEVHPPIFFNTVLTQVAPMLAAQLLSDTLTGLIIAPLEALALRELAIAACRSRNIGTALIYDYRRFEGFSLAALANFLTAELLHTMAQSEVFAICTGLAMHYHYTEEEWAVYDKKHHMKAESSEGEES